jgi:hypothetical protein
MKNSTIKNKENSGFNVKVNITYVEILKGKYGILWRMELSFSISCNKGKYS